MMSSGIPEKKNSCLQGSAFNQSDSILPVKAYLDRIKDIVDMSDILIATPESVKEVLRSGTWSTVRYAKRAGKEVIICNPDE